MSETLYPWHETCWQQLQTSRLQQRLPHALIFNGDTGSGVSDLARQFCNSLLCDSPLDSGLACRSCSACSLLAAGSHPDRVMIEPEEAGKAIKIEMIRDLIRFIGLKSQYGKYKLVVIDPANDMTRNASNSLLKTLEEPPAGSLLILVTAHLESLPITIRSRCQIIDCNCHEISVAQQWLTPKLEDPEQALLLLKLAANAPLTALAFQQHDEISLRDQILQDLTGMANGDKDPVATATSWQGHGSQCVFRWLQLLFHDLIRLDSDVDSTGFVNIDRRSDLLELKKRLKSHQLFKILDGITELVAIKRSSTNVREDTLLENFTLRWAESLNSRHT